MINYENIWPAVASVAVTADSDATGFVTVPDTSIFSVGQVVTLSGTSLQTLILDVKEIVSPVKMFLGPVGLPRGSANATTDLSSYTTAASSAVAAALQNRNAGLNGPETSPGVLQAVYEGAPVVALRVRNALMPANPQAAKIAAGSITNSYATLITVNGEKGLMYFNCSTDNPVALSLGSTDMLFLEKGVFGTLNLRSAGIGFSRGDLIKIKYTGSAPTTGNVEVTVI